MLLDKFKRTASDRPSEAKGATYGPAVAAMERLLVTDDDAPGGAYAHNVVAYRCVRMIAEAAASVPLMPCEDGEPSPTHALCRLLASPNPDQTGPELLEQLYGQLQVHGNAYLEAATRDGVPAALFALRPDRVTVEAGPDGWPDAYLYRAGGTRRRIARQVTGRGAFLPVLHLKLFDPASDSYGQSPLKAAAQAVRTFDAACEWNRSLLANAARPSGAVVHRGPDGAPSLTGEQFDRLKSELEASFQGGRNAGRPMVLDGGLEWQAMGMSPAEMDFVQLKNAAARDVALAFGVPPQLLGIPGDNTYATYKEANLAFWRQTVLPLVSKTAAGLSAWLGGPRTSVTYEAGGVDALSSERSERLSRITSADFLTDAEKRVALGFPAEPVR